MRTSLISRVVVVVGAALLCLASGCSVRKLPPNPNVARPDGGGDGPGGGKGGYVRPNVGACASPPADKKGNGEACGCHDECGSGKCVDGVCCNNACLGTCQACNVPGLMGTCSPVPDGLAPVLPGQCQSQPAATCGPDGLCDGKGGCRNHPDGTVCATGRCQADGAAVADAKVCSGGSCTAAANIPCAPFACDDTTDRCHSRCTTDDQCAGVPCTNGQCGRKPLGAACDDANECLSGHCVDDVCCNLACAGGCVSCKEVGKVGQCSPVAAGNPDPHDKCLEQEPATCGQTGVCNGTGGCATYPAGTICRPASCNGASLTPASVCNAQGTCVPGTNLSCAPYVCEGNACRGSCLDDGQCLAPASCQSGSCGPKGLGQPCAAGSECASSFCVDGVCCESACEGKCSFCALPNAPGRCQNAPLGSLDPRAAAGVTDPNRICADEGVASCGQNGRCDGEGGCQRYPDGSMCTPESCDRATHRYSVGLCLAGICNPGGRDCAPYTCNGNNCALRCASTADCASPHVCQANSCGKIPDGGTVLGQQPVGLRLGHLRPGGLLQDQLQRVLLQLRPGRQQGHLHRGRRRRRGSGRRVRGHEARRVQHRRQVRRQGRLPQVRPGQPVLARQLRQRAGAQGLVLHRRRHLPRPRGGDLHAHHRLQHGRDRLRARVHPGQPVRHGPEVPVGPVWAAGDRPVLQRQDRLPIRLLRRRRLLQRGLRRHQHQRLSGVQPGGGRRRRRNLRRPQRSGLQRR